MSPPEGVIYTDHEFTSYLEHDDSIEGSEAVG